MAESDEISMKKWLDVALNPIGSLALVERFDESKASLLRTFNILSTKVVELILSPYGFRIVESFLSVDEISVRLAESLSEEWSGLEQVLRTEKGRYVCETLLKKKMKLFAHKIITTAPRNWWLKNIEALTILIKAITFSDVDVAKEFIFNEQMAIDMCDAPEGLYCILKVISKSRDQPSWKDAFTNLILLKCKSTTGCEALAQAILYGDYLVNEMVEIICCHRESFDNSTVSLIIRLIEHGSASVKELIVKCLCVTKGNPVIAQIRNTKRFAHFTPSQRKRLDDCMASTRVCSVVDDCLTALTTNEFDSLSAPDAQNKKRRSESHASPQSAAKKPRGEGAEPQTSQTTVLPLSTVTLPAAIPPVSTVPILPTVTTPSVVPTVTATSSMLAPSIVPSPPTTQPTVASSATVPLSLTVTPPPTMTPHHTVASSATVPISTTTPPLKRSISSLSPIVPPSSSVPAATVPIPVTTPSVKPHISSLSPTVPPSPSVPAVVVTRQANMPHIDPGMDVISMAMSEKYRSLISKLEKGTPKLRLTVFNCIRNALLPLMMDERGSEVVKWFIVNGTVKQKEDIERKVEETIEDLTTNGGYGGAIVALVIENCADSEKKKELSEKSMKVIESSRDFPSSPLVNNNNNEVEVVEQKINIKRAEKSTVAKVSPPVVSIAIGQPTSQKIELQSDQGNTVAEAIEDPVSPKINVRPVDRNTVAKVAGIDKPIGRGVSCNEAKEIRQVFAEIDEKMRQNKLCGVHCRNYAERIEKKGVSQLFIDLVQERVSAWATDEQGLELLHVLTQNRKIRPHVIYAVASVLHLLGYPWGPSIVRIMLAKLTRNAFATHCISHRDDSPLVKLFLADMATKLCLEMATMFVNECQPRVRALLISPTGRTIAGSENGRRFIELLATRRPKGRGWVDLLYLISAAPIDQSPHNDGRASNAAENRPVEQRSRSRISAPNYWIYNLYPISHGSRHDPNDDLAANTAENRPAEKSTSPVKTETEETASREKSSAEKQANTQPTVASPRRDTVSTSQVVAVASPRRNTATPPKNESPSIYQYIFSKLFS